jgi:AcrR family transcriptional regulator
LDKETIWIKKGYEYFALKGEQGLIVEKMAQEIGVNKSSFYYYFTNMPYFIEKLLKYHLTQSVIIAEKEKELKIDKKLPLIKSSNDKKMG